ncbi:hypothetical protein [Acidovorax sp.]|uniref:hypothetical protein n=1 Tax=Acidovorax sp. TaxID=1872122 RepID=UPI00391F231C
MPTPTQTHALLWSQSQCALHIEPIADMLSENRQAYATDRRMDYVPIYFGTDDECHQAATAVRNTMHQRQQARPPLEPFPELEGQG